jgi:prepilin-type N-terminal cleavage/methylation domain-containing protein
MRQSVTNSSLAQNRSAFTLVEVLVALALTGLLLSITGRMAVSALRDRDVVAKRLGAIDAHAAIFDQLARDFKARLPDGVGSDTPASVAVFALPSPVIRMNVLSPLPQAQTQLHVAQFPIEVRYRLVQKNTGIFDLVRETLDLTTPGAIPLRRTVARGLSRWDVEILADGEWGSQYPTEAEEPAAIQALYVGITLPNGETASRLFLGASQ